MMHFDSAWYAMSSRPIPSTHDTLVWFMVRQGNSIAHAASRSRVHHDLEIHVVSRLRKMHHAHSWYIVIGTHDVCLTTSNMWDSEVSELQKTSMQPWF